MQSKYIFLICILFLGSSCTYEKQAGFLIGDKLLTYEKKSELTPENDIQYINFYTKGYEMQLLDPMTKDPYTGTIVDDHNLFKGRYSIEDGFMKELITYYEDGSPSYFAVYDEGEIIKMRSWYKDGTLKSKLDGGKDWEYLYFGHNGVQKIHIENNIKTEYFADGKIKSQIPFDPSHVYHGIAIVYNEDGTIKARLEYHSGKLVALTEA